MRCNDRQLVKLIGRKKEDTRSYSCGRSKGHDGRHEDINERVTWAPETGHAIHEIRSKGS